MLNRNWLPSVSVVVCLACFGYWFQWSWSFPLHDFANTYFASYFFSSGSFDISIFDPYSFNKKIADAGFTDIFASFNPNPPFIAWFFFPLILMPPFVAKAIFTAFTGILFFVSVFRLASTLNVNRWLILTALPVLFFFPLRNQVLFGQTYFLLFTLLIEGFLAHEKKRFVLAGTFWSIAIFIKVFPLILFLWLAIRREWKMFGSLAIGCVLLLTVSVLLQGSDVWLTFFFDVLPPHQQGYISSEYTPYQSMYMFLKYHMVREPLLNPQPLLDSPLLMATGVAVFSTLCLVAIASIASTTQPMVSFSVLLVGSLLLSPYSSTYSLVLLIPLWLVLLDRATKTRTLLASLAVFVICNIPMGVFQSHGILFPRLMLLVLFFLASILFFRPKVSWAYFLFLIPLLVPTLTKGTSQSDGDRVLDNENEILIFDYSIQEGKLLYHFWEEGGPQIADTEWKVESTSSEGLSVTDGQITWQGKPITNSASQKTKPMLINGDTILFLSDYHKGRGFYTLRYLRVANEVDR